MRYDAFISYRHGELDGLVAERLHKLLETYRIPRQLAKKLGRNKLNRIFRDRDELPTSSNLSDSINDALENSSFLLLICSKRTCASQWVMREVERFGELHGKDRIITLLIDGEPDDSFPPGLRERQVDGETIFVEPLAADIRAETWKKSLKLLNEEKLRLLSPILGCAFDDLRRRHHRRRVQRIASVVSAGFAFTLSFGGFSTWQYLQINQQMQLKLKNQSYVLAEYADTLRQDGDPDTAALLALAALPQNAEKPERPMVPAAERALADALAVYDVKDGFRPYKALTLPSSPSKIVLSPEETYAIALAPYALTVMDTETGAVRAILPTVNSVLADAAFVSDHVVVYTGPDGLVAYDLLDQKQLWQGAPAAMIAVSADGSTIAAADPETGTAAFYSSDGTEKGHVDFGALRLVTPIDLAIINPRNTLFALNNSGSRLAVSFADGSLHVFDTKTGKRDEVHPASYATHFEGGFQKDMLAFSAWGSNPHYSTFQLYKVSNGQIINAYASDTDPHRVFVNEKDLYVAVGSQIIAVEATTGNVTGVSAAGGPVLSLSMGGQRLLMCEASGDYRITDLQAPNSQAQVFSSAYPCHLAAAGSRFMLTGSWDSATVRLLRYTDASHQNVFAYTAADSFSEAKIHTGLGRAVLFSYRGLQLYDTATGKEVARQNFPDPLTVLDVRYEEASGNVAVLYESQLRIYSGENGSLLLETQGKPGVPSVTYTDFGVSVLTENGEAVLYQLNQPQTPAAVIQKVQGDKAVPLGNYAISSQNGQVFFDGQYVADGEIVGAGKGWQNDADNYFAVSGAAGGKVFAIKGNTARECFSFPALGAVEVYFTGGHAFVSARLGEAVAYNMDGKVVQRFGTNDYLSETRMLNGQVLASYTSAQGKLYSLLLAADSLEPVAYLPGFAGQIDDNTIVLDDGAGMLRSVDLLDAATLKTIAQQRLGGRVLTPEEQQQYKVG